VRSFLDGTIDPKAMRRIGLPWSETLVRRTLIGGGRRRGAGGRLAPGAAWHGECGAARRCGRPGIPSNVPGAPRRPLRSLPRKGTGSAVLAARLAVQFGVAVMCNGGTHHAHAGYGAGWCIFNDQARLFGGLVVGLGFCAGGGVGASGWNSV
jgi:hypothetical protein